MIHVNLLTKTKSLLTLLVFMLFVCTQAYAYTISLNSDESKVIIDFTNEKSMTGFGTNGGQNYNWAYTLTGDNSGTIPKSFVVIGECSDPLTLLSDLPYGPEYIDMSAMISTTSVADILSNIANTDSKKYTITGIVLPKGSSIPEEASMLSNCTKLGYVIAPNNDATSATILVTNSSLTNINEDILSSVTNIDISTTVSNISSNLLATLRATGATVNYNSNNDQEGNTGGEGGNTDGEGGNTDTDNLTLDQKIQKSMQLTDVPTIYLTIPAAEGKELNSVVKKITDPALDPYFDATIQVVDNSPETSEKHLKSFTDDVKIKVRGNSTANLDKKPYRLKFAKDEKDDAGNVTVKHKHDLLGDGYSKRNWTLLANMYDGSKIRNALNYRIGQLVGMEFCPGYKFVDLVINGEYRGCYQVSDHVEVGSHRIDVDEDTGWYVEASRGDMIEAPSATGGSLEMSIKNPEPATKAETDQLISDVEAFFTEFGQKAASHNTNLADPTLGWRSIADEESMVAFYIGTNLTANYDGFMTVKMFRDVTGKDTKLHFGPLWDMDLAYGHFKGSVPGKLVEDIENGNFRWYPKAFMEKDARFVKKVHDKWHNLVENGLVDELNAYIDKLADNVRQSQELDYTKKWTVRMKGMDGTYDSFDDAIAYLKGFIAAHVPLVQDYIDGQYVALHCADLPDEPEDVDPDEPGDTPTGDLGALVDLGNGKYSYTGSASTFKEGTEITITTSTEETTLSNYITEGNTWNTSKTTTLTAADVTTLAANSYTFFMNATNGEVKAVNVKVPAFSAGAEFNKEYISSYTSGDFVVPASNFNANATSIKVILKNNLSTYSNGWNGNYGFDGHPWKAAYSWTITNTQEITVTDTEDIQSVAQYGMGITGPKDMTITVINYGTSQETTTQTHTLTLEASPEEGGTVTGAGTYDEGTTVLIKAIPNEGYRFSKWSDDNTNAVRSVTLNEAITLTAIFAAEGSADEDPFNEQGERKQLTGLPTIYLNAETINGEWFEAAVEVFDKDNKLYQGANWSKAGVSKKGNINVSVQYQGSGADNSKNSYRLKFNDKINLLSATGSYKQWVLLANDDDPTMLNNALAKELGDAIGMPWTPGYQFVDLYVNDKYMGTYQLTDRVKAEEGRSLVSGGNKDLDWQVRFNDNAELAEDGTQDFIAASQASGVNIIYRNPDPKDITSDALTTLKTDMTTYFGSVFAETTTNTFGNISENVDKQQLINWYIAQEILGVYKGFSSIEAYRSITEGAADNLLHFGPLWDSEKGFGNTGEAPAIDMSDLNTTGSHKGLMIEYAAFDKMKNIFKYLWTQDWFKSGVKTKWDAIKTTLPTTLSGTITTLKGTIAASQLLNAQKWNTASYEDALAATNTYITSRFAYLDKKFNELAGAAHVHSYTAYIDNGNGTHSRKCSADDAVEDGSAELHTLTVSNGKAICSVCHLEIADVAGTAEEKVYMLNAGTSKVQYITKTSGFTPTANTLYPINEKPEEGTVFDNVYWRDGVDKDGKPIYYADNIIVTDGTTAWLGDVKVSAKNATYSRTMSASSVWGTVCLPFKVQKNDDVTLYELASSTVDGNGGGTMYFKEATSTGGLTPLLYLKNNATATEVSFQCSAQADGYVTVKAADKISKNTSSKVPSGWQFYGNVKETKAIGQVSGEEHYYIASNKFWHSNGTIDVAPFRAYFSYTAPAGTSPAKAFSLKIMNDNIATDVADAANRPLAIFANAGGVSIVAPKDMQVVIYNAGGMQVETINATKDTRYNVSLPAGIYMVNGLKFAVK